MNYTDEKITKKPRIYFKDDFDVTNWEEVKEKLEEIINFDVNSANDLIIMLEKAGELSDIMSEEMAWRYITMTRYADNPENSKKFNEFYANIVSKSIPYDFKLKKKFYDSPYKNDLDKEKYSHLVKIISNDIELYREYSASNKRKRTYLKIWRTIFKAYRNIQRRRKNTFTTFRISKR